MNIDNTNSVRHVLDLKIGGGDALDLSIEELPSAIQPLGDCVGTLGSFSTAATGGTVSSMGTFSTFSSIISTKGE